MARHAIREEKKGWSRAELSGVIIDPGRGVDHGLIAQVGWAISETDLLWDLASRLEGRMAAIGMEAPTCPVVTVVRPTQSDAATANAVGADLMISLRCETQTSLAANGGFRFHFGNSHGSVSSAAILPFQANGKWWRASGLQHCRVHGRTWDLLRLTGCRPFRSISACQPHDRGMLVSTRTRDAIMKAFSPRSNDCIC